MTIFSVFLVKNASENGAAARPPDRVVYASDYSISQLLHFVIIIPTFRLCFFWW